MFPIIPMDDYLKRILTAHVYDVAVETPLDYLPKLAARLGHDIWLKREDLQPVFSFKLRGAYNKIARIDPEIRQKGVICASAGNHAQGVALSAQRLKIPAVIVMPQTTPSIKVQAVASFGAEVVLYGDAFDEANHYAQELAKARQLTFVHPYDDPDVIAGQGTIAMEILRQHSGPLDAVFIAVGGGGLIAGMGAYIKALRPEIRVIGVEPEDAPSMYRALQAKERVLLNEVGIFADGVAVRQVGVEPFRIAQQTVDEMILVSTDEICAAIRDIFNDTRSIAEPAGALGIAGLKKYVKQLKASGHGQNGRFVALNCGANINFDRLRHVAERAEFGEQREALLAVTIPEKPGSFLHFCRTLGKRAITEFNYRFAADRSAHIFVGVELTGGAAERQQIIEKLRAADYAVLDMTDNEMAKLHIRYMIGGRAPEQLENETLYRVQFPERPGALLRFLEGINGLAPWNISLFHYRNHGSAYGRVLVGLQIPPDERRQFEQFLNELHYGFRYEGDNPAYNLFLGQ